MDILEGLHFLALTIGVFYGGLMLLMGVLFAWACFRAGFYEIRKQMIEDMSNE